MIKFGLRKNKMIYREKQRNFSTLLKKCLANRQSPSMLSNPNSHSLQMWLNPLPNNKVLDLMKLKAFSDEKLNVAKMMISLFDRLQAFSPFPTVFSKTFFFKVNKSRDCVVKSEDTWLMLYRTSISKTLQRKAEMLVISIFSSSHNIFSPPTDNLIQWVICKELNPFPNKPWFLCVCSTSILTTLWEKKKLL